VNIVNWSILLIGEYCADQSRFNHPDPLGLYLLIQVHTLYIYMYVTTIETLLLEKYSCL